MALRRILRGGTCVFAAVAATVSAGPAPHPTAVYTLDHRRTEIAAEQPRELRSALEAWVRGCRIVEGGAIYRLECAEAPEPDPAAAHSMLANLALFRDLDETVYLAACPVLDEERLRRMENEARKPEEEREEDPEYEADLRDCADMETGRTFSAELEGNELRAVIRGRQLRLTVFQTQPKPRTTSTPYIPQPTRGSLGPAGPPTTSTAELNPVDEPNWKPPEEPQSRARARSPEASLRDPSVAKTSLPAGRVRIECKDPEAEIWLDEAFLGFAPLDTPLPAGRHQIRAKGEDRETKTDIELEAGASLTVDVCRQP